MIRISASLTMLAIAGLMPSTAHAHAPPMPNCAIVGDPTREDVYSLCRNGVAYFHRYGYYGSWQDPERITMSRRCQWDGTQSRWICGSRTIQCTQHSCTVR